MLKLDMGKATEGLKLSLQKAGISPETLAKLQMEVAMDVDVSGSFEDEHKDGSTNDLMTRLLPWSLVFDPDKKVDVFTFSNGPENAHRVEVEMNAGNYEGFVGRHIINRVPGWRGGTDYSYVLEANLQHFGWLCDATQAAPKKSLFGRLLGGSGTAVATPSAPVEKKRSLVIFITDGDNTDKDRTEQVLAASEARGDEVYFLFIGYSNQGGKFPFLKRIGDRFNNTGLVVVPDLRKFVAQTDDALNSQLLGDELIQWLKAA